MVQSSDSLLVFILIFLLFIVDLEVAQLIRVLRVGDNSQPVPKVVFLQILLSKVLQVPKIKKTQLIVSFCKQTEL